MAYNDSYDRYGFGNGDSCLPPNNCVSPTGERLREEFRNEFREKYGYTPSEREYQHYKVTGRMEKK